MHLQESGEMYLEAILVLSKRQSRVRSVDICEFMGFSKPSVSRGLARLKADDYILVKEGCNCVWLTEKGKEVAERTDPVRRRIGERQHLVPVLRRADAVAREGPPFGAAELRPLLLAHAGALADRGGEHPRTAFPDGEAGVRRNAP